MVKILKLSTFTIFIIYILIGAAWAADDNWKKIGESDGIEGYARPTIRSSVDEIKAVGIVDAPIAVLEAVIRDISVMPEYIFLCKEAALINTPDMKSGGDVVYFYSLTDLPFPVSDRDAVAKSLWSIDKSTGTVYCHTEGIKTSYKLSKDIVRTPLSIIDCTLIPRGTDKTEVIYQVLGDPCGALPSFIVNMLTNDYGIKTVAGLRQMVKKDKFRNAKKIITTTAKVKR
ncbi:MAG: START domain-containing protein [Deltaproteobacteria bacterium]|nr:START domain-containing protein [Deltaproteobacteria bacterium]